MKKKAFTLIELIAVLVILAILALIVTPLVMNIISSARISADKRSIDAYGRSIEIAIAGYLLDTGTFPTSMDQLTIEYSGDEVVCTTTQLNTDSSVYLADCTVDGRSVEGYTYGKGGGEEPTQTYPAYQVGDEVTYNNVDYYVIKDSSTSEDSVTLLKAEPLSVAEVNEYGGVGTANNHVNMHATTDISADYYQTAYNNNGYGGMQYYSSDTCSYYGTSDGCTADYEQSEIKYVVDDWRTKQAPSSSEARLMTFKELTEILGFEYQQVNPTLQGYLCTESTPGWVSNHNYSYWTMSQYNDLSFSVWGVYGNCQIGTSSVGNFGSGGSYYGYFGVVRPVITISKSALSS